MQKFGPFDPTKFCGYRFLSEKAQSVRQLAHGVDRNTFEEGLVF